MEVHTLFLTLNNMKVVTIYVPNGILGETFATSTLQESISYQDHLFSWIQSEYNLSCMLSKYWELLKILQVLQKLLITNDLIPLISSSAT